MFSWLLVRCYCFVYFRFKICFVKKNTVLFTSLTILLRSLTVAHSVTNECVVKKECINGVKLEQGKAKHDAFSSLSVKQLFFWGMQQHPSKNATYQSQCLHNLMLLENKLFTPHISTNSFQGAGSYHLIYSGHLT